MKWEEMRKKVRVSQGIAVYCLQEDKRMKSATFRKKENNDSPYFGSNSFILLYCMKESGIIHL